MKLNALVQPSGLLAVNVIFTGWLVPWADVLGRDSHRAWASCSVLLSQVVILCQQRHLLVGQAVDDAGTLASAAASMRRGRPCR